MGLVPVIYARKLATQYGLEIIPLPVPEIEQKFQLIWHRRFDSDAGHSWLRDTIEKAVSQVQEVHGAA